VVRKRVWAQLEREPLSMVAVDSFALPAEARATAWADGLEPEGATPLATYDHRHFDRFAAATTHRFGRGQVTYVGTLPDPRSVGRSPGWCSSGRGALPLGQPAPVGAGHRRHHQSGRRLWFVSNWAWEPVTVPTPVAGVALLSGRGVREGGSVELGAWDVEIAAEA
jgi:beta-galactosidase